MPEVDWVSCLRPVARVGDGQISRFRYSVARRLSHTRRWMPYHSAPVMTASSEAMLSQVCLVIEFILLSPCVLPLEGEKRIFEYVRDVAATTFL